MNIAVISEDGKTVSQHFGKATQYVVVKTDCEKILGTEVRKKVGHVDLMLPGAKEESCCCKSHGFNGSIFDRHRPMVFSILDCEVLLAGGMGWEAYEGLKCRGIQPVITDVQDIDQAVRLYLWGNLPNLLERLH